MKKAFLVLFSIFSLVFIFSCNLDIPENNPQPNPSGQDDPDSPTSPEYTTETVKIDGGTKRIYYTADGTVAYWFEYKYNPNTKELIKQTKYNGDGTVAYWHDYEYNPDTKRLITETRFNSDGSVLWKREYNPDTGKRFKQTNYYDNGTKSVTEYNPETEKRTCKTSGKSADILSDWYGALRTMVYERKYASLCRRGRR